nr:MAG TPA: hypothetical protein [Bacteriophage sp.]
MEISGLLGNRYCTYVDKILLFCIFADKIIVFCPHFIYLCISLN